MEHSPELKKVVDAIVNRISMDGHSIQVVNIDYGAFEQIFDSYAAVKLRRVAARPDMAEVNSKLYGYANAVQNGLI